MAGAAEGLPGGAADRAVATARRVAEEAMQKSQLLRQPEQSKEHWKEKYAREGLASAWRALHTSICSSAATLASHTADTLLAYWVFGQAGLLCLG